MDIRIELTKSPKAKPTDESNLGFGHIFTDHMFIMDYETGKGWHDARIVPYGPLDLMPSAMCLHYAQEVFEGLKAYRTAEGKIQLFRPIENARRLNRSAARFSMPEIPEDDFSSPFIRTIFRLLFNFQGSSDTCRRFSLTACILYHNRFALSIVF